MLCYIRQGYFALQPETKNQSQRTLPITICCKMDFKFKEHGIHKTPSIQKKTRKEKTIYNLCILNTNNHKKETSVVMIVWYKFDLHLPL